MRSYIAYIHLLLAVVLSTHAFSQSTDLQQRLAKISGLTVEKFPVPVGSHFTEAFHLILKQPNDHNNSDAGTFEHHLYLMHTGFDKPVLLETEGYAADPEVKELSALLKCNQLVVEYRYYGKSKPDSIPWQYLTNAQAVEDYHRIREIFKKIYPGKWISSGYSKGGETTLIYKSKYPRDVDLSVPYVAPMIISTEDARTDFFLDTVGTDECRDKLIAFQRMALKRRKEVIPLMTEYAKKNETSFDILTVNGAYEYAVLEYTFSFWQRTNGDCSVVPGDAATPQDIFNEVSRTGGWRWVTDKGVQGSQQSVYQHHTELGYYAFVTKYVRDLLEVVCDGSNAAFWIRNDVAIDYKPDYMRAVRKYLKTKGDDILYIYGGHDTWTACAMTLTPGKTNAKQFFAPGAGHYAKIKHFPPATRKQIYRYIQSRVGVKISAQ